MINEHMKETYTHDELRRKLISEITYKNFGIHHPYAGFFSLRHMAEDRAIERLIESYYYINGIDKSSPLAEVYYQVINGKKIYKKKSKAPYQLQAFEKPPRFVMPSLLCLSALCALLALT